MSSTGGVRTHQTLCVLSVGRSGSSLATRALNLLGVHLGAEDDMLPANPDNELGFWEHSEVYAINEEILATFGGSWYRPPALDEGWSEDRRLDGLRERARAVLEGFSQSGAPRWAFKDPRSAWLLEFWRGLVPKMDYIICVRRAREVIASVQQMPLSGIEPAETARLWLDVHARILAETQAERRLFVFYEDWFADPAEVAAGLARFVGDDTDDTADADAIESVIRSFDPHARRAIDAAELCEQVSPPELDTMYAHLRGIARCDVENSARRAQDAHNALALARGYGLRLALERETRRVREAASAAESEASALRLQLAESEQQIAQLQDEVRRHQQWLDGLQSSASWRITAPLRAAKRQLIRL